MYTQEMHQPIIFTNKASCRDCYRCVRVCPVKAIKMKNGQASIIDEKCIQCGTCIKECPQKAKQYRRDTEKVKTILKENELVAASIAPSFSGIFSDVEILRLPSVLRQLGFEIIAETSVGAEILSKQTNTLVSQNNKIHINSSCPALVNYIEKYSDNLVEELLPLKSPAVTHAIHLKEKYGKDLKIVLISPCIAKKYEIEREENTELIDAAITFEELKELLEEKNLDLLNCEESGFDEISSKRSSFFALNGGFSKAAFLETDLFSINSLAVTGVDEIRESLRFLSETNHQCFLDGLFCKEGCLNGPAADSEKNIYQKKLDVQKYAESKIENKTEFIDNLFLATRFLSKKVKEDSVSENEIKSIFERTGKYTHEDELNCNTCGYDTCREKAKAVVNGIAEIEMCLPYMRRRAERRSDKIMESSPNGIVIINEKLEIVQMNPAFKKMFMCTDSLIGKRISYLIDPEPFIKMITGEIDKYEIKGEYSNYNLVCHQIHYKLDKVNQYAGVFVNITKSENDRVELQKLKSETIQKAQELFDHQVNLAQQLAKFIGESTAKGEEIVENLIKLTEKQN